MARPVTLFTGQWADLPLETVAKKPAPGATTAWSSPAGATTSRSTRPSSEDALLPEQMGPAQQVRPEVLGHQHAPGGPVRVRRPHRRAPQGHPAGPHLGRRRPRGRAPARGRGDEEHRPRRRQVRRQGGQRLYRLEDLADAGHVPARPAGHDRGRATRISPIAGTPSSTCSTQVGVKFALEVHPSEIAYDFWTHGKALEAIDNRAGFGINFDPSHLYWQMVDPVAFVYEFGDRIYHMHVKESVRVLDGRNGILGSHLLFGDHRRGWDFVSPGRGGVPFEQVFRALNDVGYQGPLLGRVGGQRHEPRAGRPEALAMVRSLSDFTPSEVAFDAAFQSKG